MGKETPICTWCGKKKRHNNPLKNVVIIFSSTCIYMVQSIFVTEMRQSRKAETPWGATRSCKATMGVQYIRNKHQSLVDNKMSGRYNHTLINKYLGSHL